MSNTHYRIVMSASTMVSDGKKRSNGAFSMRRCVTVGVDFLTRCSFREIFQRISIVDPIMRSTRTWYVNVATNTSVIDLSLWMEVRSRQEDLGPFFLLAFVATSQLSSAYRSTTINPFTYNGVTRNRKRTIKKKIYFLYHRNIRICEVTYKE